MILSLIIFICLLVIVLIGIYFGVRKQEKTEIMLQPEKPLIHTSGIYSIVRKNPREDVNECKPAETEIRKYLSEQNVDINRLPIEAVEKERLIAHWNESLNDNIKAVEQGDLGGVEFYFYDFPAECPGCKGLISKGQFVTREEIYNNPRIIPPFHLGCTCRLKAHHGKDPLRDTTELHFLPFFEEEGLPRLPEWKSITKLSS